MYPRSSINTLHQTLSGILVDIRPFCAQATAFQSLILLLKARIYKSNLSRLKRMDCSPLIVKTRTAAVLSRVKPDSLALYAITKSMSDSLRSSAASFPALMYACGLSGQCDFCGISPMRLIPAAQYASPPTASPSRRSLSIIVYLGLAIDSHLHLVGLVSGT
jgi:hypothetical protein